MKKNPAEIAGTRYKDEKLMSRVQKTDGTSRCFAQMKTLNDSPYIVVGCYKYMSDYLAGGYALVWRYNTLVDNQLCLIMEG